MQFCVFGSEVDPRIDFNKMHYLANNYEEAKRLFAHGGAIFNTTDRLVGEQNIKILSIWPVYFGGIALSKEAPSPGDPNVPKNIKIRVPPEKGAELTAAALGYIPTPINFSEAFTAIETGIVDGAIGSGGEGYYSIFRDVVKYFYKYNDHFENWYLMMNLDQWNSLAAEDQKIVMDRAIELESNRLAAAEEREAYYAQKLTDYGIEVISFNENELKAFAAKVREEVWPELEETIGPELMAIVKESVGQ
jgi:TRAP-type C4-dicarboxylate transport system substrate-binding protein